MNLDDPIGNLHNLYKKYSRWAFYPNTVPKSTPDEPPILKLSQKVLQMMSLLSKHSPKKYSRWASYPNTVPKSTPDEPPIQTLSQKVLQVSYLSYTLSQKIS